MDSYRRSILRCGALVVTRYVKALSALLGGVSTWGLTAAVDNAISQLELFGLLGVLSTVLAVYAFPNAPTEGDG